jgi:isoquinoline 1-oxidoreductase
MEETIRFELFDLQTQQRRSLPTEFNAFLQIAEDGTVNCYTGKIEMGQGAITSLVQIMADEIEVPFERVKMVMGDTDLCPWDGGTSGSNTIRTFSPRMRVAAADVSEAEKIKGIQVVRDGDFIAVLSDDRDKIDQAIT